MNKNYLFTNIEKNVQKYWNIKKTFKVIENNNIKKYYILCMIPYPSGNLHMGHVRNYTIGDIISRYQRMNGKNVMQPMGWDAFGLPAETSAIKNNIFPSIWTYKNIKNMKIQLKSLGFSYDWDREIITCKPEYYKWEQWFFIKLYEKKLIYKKKSLVNWCKYDKTVLANEQVINGNCWRCDNKIKKKNLYQWFLKINIYAEQLLNDLKYLKHWPLKVINMQKNWIGKTKSFIFFLNILNSNKKIFVQIYNLNFLKYIAYIIISLDNPIAINESKKNTKINEFILKNTKKNLINFKKKGINSNIFVIHPIFKIKLPVWIVNFNLNDNINKSDIAVPKYNKYDLFFAKKYNIPIKLKISKKYSLKFNNLKKKNFILNKLIKFNFIKTKKFYKLFNWNISRQRYWGAPIPIDNDKNIVMSENQLPIILSENILKNNIINSIKTKTIFDKILIDKKNIQIKINTFDTFIESSWYYARYACPKYNKNILKLKSVNYWLPIDQYIGGIEHAIMHLLYFRFFHKLFRDFGLVNCNEPVKKLICQGMVLSHAFYYLNKKNEKIWVSKNQIRINFNNKKKIIKLKNQYGKQIKYAGIIKMSKSKNNGINPKKIIKKYGSDTVRLFIIFASPIKMELEWKEFQLIGIFKFLKRFWKIFFNHINQGQLKPLKIKKLTFNQKKIIFSLHKLIYEVNYDIKYYQFFNIAIFKIMKFINKINFLNNKNIINKFIFHECLLILIRLLYPFIPHICFKIWKLLGESIDIDFVSWPIFNKKFLIKKLKIIIQINSKFFKKLIIKSNYKKEFILDIIKKKFTFKNNILNNIYKIIYINKKIFNIILKF